MTDRERDDLEDNEKRIRRRRNCSECGGKGCAECDESKRPKRCPGTNSFVLLSGVERLAQCPACKFIAPASHESFEGVAIESMDGSVAYVPGISTGFGSVAEHLPC